MSAAALVALRLLGACSSLDSRQARTSSKGLTPVQTGWPRISPIKDARPRR